VLTESREVADYFERVAGASGQPKAASNWVMNEVLRTLKETGRPLAESPVPPEALAELMGLLARGEINGTTAKDVFVKMWSSGEGPRAIVEREGLGQVSDQGALRALVAEAVAQNPGQAADYRGGKTAALGWFVGQVMRKTGGKANPQLVSELLKEALGPAS